MPCIPGSRSPEAVVITGASAGAGRATVLPGIPLRSAYCAAKAVAGNKIAPGSGGRGLAKNGDESQQYDGQEDPHRAHNLWEPLPGDPGAPGGFDGRAT